MYLIFFRQNAIAYLIDSSGLDGKDRRAMWETWVGSLGQEDPLEKGMATHSSILAWRIP